MDLGAAEVGIVGAGFAGLAAALMLRRHRHSAIVFDGGPCRNARASEVHGYLGLSDVSGSELRRLAVEQVHGVGGQIVDVKIDAVAREPGPAFTLSSGDGRQWRVQRLLIATGVQDTYPDIDNFFDFYGRSVHVCPHCDAYEWRDRPVAIVAWSPAALPFSRKLKEWTNEITVVTDGRSPELSPAERQALADEGIGLITRTVRHFEGSDGQLEALCFDDDTRLPVAAAFFNIGSAFQTDLAEQLGCRLRDEGCIAVDDRQRTSVERVWAAGDVTGEEQLVSVAAAQGVKAAVDIYRSLSDNT